MQKISFVGDIMCELPQLKASKINKYNFDKMFEEVEKYLKKSDYVIGNLETPISNFLGYTNDLYCFNTPKKFLKSLKKSHFNLLVTANNHALDRGIIGLKQTMKNIKKYNMDYIGTKLSKKEDNIKIKLGDTTISFYAYTYGTNYSYNKYLLKDNQKYMINLLKDQKDINKTYKRKDFYKPLITRYIKTKIKELIKYNKPLLADKNIVIDNINDKEWKIDNKIISNIKKTINNDKSDIKILLLHTGGQFNKTPGTYTEEIINKIKQSNVNTIIATHPHIVQKCTYDKKLIAYSLGNFSISPSTPYLIFEDLPEYSIILNMYIENKKIIKYTFTVLKTIEDSNNYLKIYLVNELIEKENNNEKKEKLINDLLFIYNKVLSKSLKQIDIKEEYEIGD